MQPRRLVAADRARLAELLERVTEFTSAERAVALELADAALADPEGSGYRFLLADDDAASGAGGADEPPACLGYACFGQTPMTAHTWDLYWIAVDPAARGVRLGAALLEGMEEAVAAGGGRIVRVETSSRSPYQSAIRLYEASGYERIGTIADFYAPGDDLIVLAKRLLLH